MRLQGRLTDWDDKRGFGYLTPTGGGERVWMHISACQLGSQRPAEGMLLTYQVQNDRNGRQRAVTVRPARLHARPRNSVHAARPGSGRQTWRPLAGLASLSGLVTAAALDLLPWPLVAVSLGLSLLAYVAYALDKRAARRDQRRTPEATLQLLGLLGGWPGALVAQGQFRHKTAKAGFQALFWVCVLLNSLGLLVSPLLLQRLAG